MIDELRGLLRAVTLCSLPASLVGAAAVRGRVGAAGCVFAWGLAMVAGRIGRRRR